MKHLLILGTGCSRCRRLYEVTEQAAKDTGVPYEMSKVTDLKQIMALGVMATPALVVDGNLKVAGRVPSVDEIKHVQGGEGGERHLRRAGIGRGCLADL